MPVNYELTRDFMASEFACRHCGAHGVQRWFVEQVQALRDHHGKPVHIHSGFRCAGHPVERKKPTPGRHYEGIAADISIPGVDLRDIWRSLIHFPAVTGIGVNRHLGWIHLDARPLKHAGARVVWAYDRSGAEALWSGKWEELP